MTARARPGPGRRGRPPRAAGQVSASVGPRRLLPAESEDLAYQATADALLAITAKLGAVPGREPVHDLALQVHPPRGVGQNRTALLASPGGALERRGPGPAAGPVRFRARRQSEWRDLLAAVRRAVDDELTPRQRQVFVAIVLNNVPLDALALELASNRNAIYKMLFDARRKLRATLAAKGYLGHDTVGHS